MKVRYFKSVRFVGDWEFNLIGKHLNIRIARSQIALWWNFKPVFSWMNMNTSGRAA